MSLTERDLIFLYYITFANCIVGLVYIFILIILILIIVTKYKVRKIKRKIEIQVKNENHFRIYEKKEKVSINKANKRIQEIYHSYKVVDKTNPKPKDLLLETIVEINGRKQYSNKQNIVNKESLSESEDYIRDSYETVTKQLIFDRNEKIITRYITKESLVPIQLVEPLTNKLVKSEVISAKIPIQFERNRIIAERSETEIDVQSITEKKSVLDVIAFGDSSVHTLSVSSQTNNTSNFMADSKTVLTSDAIMSNVEFNETEVLENNIEIKEIPTVGSHLRIKEVPLVVNQINIREKKGQSIKSNTITSEVIEAEVPIIIDKLITERKIPNLIPISVYKTRILSTL